MDHDRCRDICKELFEYSSITRRQQGAQLLTGTGVRNGGVEAAEGMVSARMRLLYNYRAPAGTRWSPTMEQLRELQALFHVGGLRTPTTTQISRITARLRVHGRIEGRNVFYWFQNQKARERKRRLQMLAQDEASSSGGNGKIETSKQTIQQPKRSREGKQLATRLSLPYDHLAAEETDRSTLHLWRSRHEAEFPCAMKLAVAQEEASGLLLQNFHEAEAICAISQRRLNFHSLSPFPAAENEQSEVRNAPNAQPSAVPAMSTRFIISSTPMSATTHIEPATSAVIQQVMPILGRAARDSASTFEIVQSPAYHNSLLRDTDCGTCSRGQLPLVLFPLSPQQQGNPPDPPSSSRCSNHNQAQCRFPLVKGGRGEPSPAPPSERVCGDHPTTGHLMSIVAITLLTLWVIIRESLW